MANRIESRLAKCKLDNEKAFITYLTAGLGGMEGTKRIIEAQAGITDIIELGIPFSDPIADGPVIQDASYRAIGEGANLSKTFELMKSLREGGSQQPIVFMMYYNTIYHVGLDEFARKCYECGVDGLIVPDLPYEEQGELISALDEYDATILIQLVSPVSEKRLDDILKDAKGFVYCVSAMGVTGGDASFHSRIIDYLSDVKRRSKIPVMMGFGIRNADDIKPMRDIIEGAIVGSHFIKLVMESGFDADTARDYVSKFREEMNR